MNYVKTLERIQEDEHKRFQSFLRKIYDEISLKYNAIKLKDGIPVGYIKIPTKVKSWGIRNGR